jgi:hypothetical protein
MPEAILIPDDRGIMVYVGGARYAFSYRFDICCRFYEDKRPFRRVPMSIDG